MLYKTIEKDQLNARRSKDKLSSALLSTLISEAYSLHKRSGLDLDVATKECLNKLVKVTKSNLSQANLSEDKINLFKAELDILTRYLPKQLSPEKIAEIIFGLPDKSIGSIMKFFKENHAGEYDPKKLAEYAKLVPNQS